LALQIAPPAGRFSCLAFYALRIWDTRTGQSVDRFVGHTAQVTQLAISADGKYLASVGADKALP
jgi:WD40 repeat protein